MFNKTIILVIITFVIGVVGIVIGYSTRFSGIQKVSEQVDMKSGKARMNWMLDSRSVCDDSSGRCKNYSSSSSTTSSSWGGGSFGK